MSTPAIVINGTSGAYEQPQKFGWDSSGPYCVRTWKGTAAAIATQYNTCLALGALSEVTAGFGTHTLTARYALTITGSGGGGGEVPLDSWEFFASHVEKDMLQADVTSVEQISDDNKSLIENLMANPPGPTDPKVVLTTFLNDGTNSQTNAFAVYNLMRAGMKAVRVNAPVLRHTQTVSNQYTVKAALTNVGRILSSATLATNESIPTSVLFNMPADTSTRSNFTYGWMKMHPTIRIAARQKMQIEQEYEYGLYPPLIYQAVL